MPSPVDVIPLDPPRPSPLKQNKPILWLLQEVFGPSCPALFDIKAPLRAKDFEKIRNARSPYRVPAPSRASRKFRAPVASPLLSSCPKVSKDKLVTSRPAPGSRPRPLKLGRRGARFGTCLRGGCSGHPCTPRTPLVALRHLLKTLLPSRSPLRAGQEAGLGLQAALCALSAAR